MGGVIIGAVFGAVQLYLLILGVSSLGAPRLKLWPLLLQFLCPFAGLGLCAWLARAQLIPCAVAMSAVLIGGAAVKFVSLRRAEREGQG